MKRILTAVVLIPVVLLAVLKAADWLFALGVGAFALAAAYEYLGLVEHYGFTPFKRLTLVLIALPFICLAVIPLTPAQANVIEMVVVTLLVTFIFAPLLLLIAALSRVEFSKSLPDVATSVFAMPYTAVPFLCLLAIRSVLDGTFLLLFLFAVVWSGDVFAYYVGRIFGKRKLAPRISPGKTWEGAIASLLGSVLVGSIMFRFSVQIASHVGHWRVSDWSWTHPDPFASAAAALLLSAAVNIAAQLGDLVESMLKRGANVKDSGSLLPGHGGVLDRVDAILLAATVVLFYSVFVR
jgi:phosphatidate cytidylyltransferase